MAAYYNEFDPAAAHILKAMIDLGVIAPGEVDTRSIKEVQPDDLIGFTQCHFFAGGGLWSVAARLAGWPDDEQLWTGSCPCQPFSAAGKGAGTDDPRHLWPDFHRLISARRPPVIMGEQVAGSAGYGWFDGVRADLEGKGFASRTVDFPACSVDAPHQRNRLYWVAMEHAESERRGEGRAEHELRRGWPTPAGADASGVSTRLEGQRGYGDGRWRQKPRGSVAAADGGELKYMAYRSGEPIISGRPIEACDAKSQDDRAPWSLSRRESSDTHGSRNGTYWSDAEWIICHDDKARRTKPGLRFLVDGLPGRVDLWRVGGNAIVPEAAKEVIAAFIDVYGLPRSWRIAA